MNIDHKDMTDLAEIIADIQSIADYFADAKSHDLEKTMVDAISCIRKLVAENYSLKEQVDYYRENVVWGHYEDQTPGFYQGVAGENEINEPVTAKQVENAYRALDVYQRERDRYRHAKPEITGEYFLSGGYGAIDANMLPEFVKIVPAYGCAWEQVYQKTDKTISYEGS